MSFREPLLDLVKQVHSPFTDLLLRTDTQSGTVAYGNWEKTLFVTGKFNRPIAELDGECGLGDLNILKSLLEMAIFRTEGSRLSVTRSVDGSDITGFDFSAEHGTFARYSAKLASMVDQSVKARDDATYDWDVVIEPSKSAIAEFTSFSSLMGKTDMFTVQLGKDHKLRLGLGGSGAMHSSKIVLASDVEGDLSKLNASFRTFSLLTVLKNAGENLRLRFNAGENIVSVCSDTEYATYFYYLRGMES